MSIPVNIKNLTVWPLSADTTEAITYGTAMSLKDRFMSFVDTPKQNSSALYGDGKKTHEYIGKDGGELQLNIQSLTPTEKATLYGETTEADGTNTMGASDIIPYVMVAFEVENDDGTIDLYKYPKVMMAEQPTNIEQKTEGGVKYSTSALKGSYLFTIHDNEARYIKEDMAPTTDAAEITSWFATAAFTPYSAG